VPFVPRAASYFPMLPLLVTVNLQGRWSMPATVCVFFMSKISKCGGLASILGTQGRGGFCCRGPWLAQPVLKLLAVIDQSVEGSGTTAATQGQLSVARPTAHTEMAMLCMVQSL
jgi:hypothetical protein